MAQQTAWEREYRQPQLLTKKSEPQSDVLRYFKYLRKVHGVELEGLALLDLGSGTGRNANYVASLGNTVAGLEIAPTAIRLAKERAVELGVTVAYHQRSMGESFPFGNSTFDIAIDVMSSNSLNEAERAVYLAETARVLKPGGHLFVRTLCKDGDKHARNLIASHPGLEYDTYVSPDIAVVERVFTREDFIALYEPYFTILELSKKTNYARMSGRIYKRNYWLAYLHKRVDGSSV
jgi:SAM-dependent methyltransferase